MASCCSTSRLTAARQLATGFDEKIKNREASWNGKPGPSKRPQEMKTSCATATTPSGTDDARCIRLQATVSLAGTPYIHTHCNINSCSISAASPSRSQRNPPSNQVCDHERTSFHSVYQVCSRQCKSNWYPGRGNSTGGAPLRDENLRGRARFLKLFPEDWQDSLPRKGLIVWSSLFSNAISKSANLSCEPKCGQYARCLF